MPSGVIFGDTKTRTVNIASNLEDKEGFLVTLAEASGRIVATIAANAAAFPFVLIDAGNGAVTNLDGSVAIGGRVKVILAGTSSVGDKLTSDASGEAVTTTTDTNHYGLIALADGVDGDEIEALVSFGMVAG